MIGRRAVAVLLALAAIALPARAEIEIVPVTSPGGIAAWLYEDHSIPMLTIEASFLGGGALDADERSGATYMMAALLHEGAGDLDAPAFATAQEELAAQFGFWASDDAVSVSATMLDGARDATVELLRLALVAPRFDPEAVERVRAQALASIRMGMTDPGTLAGQAFYARAFPNHPYGRPLQGTLQTVAAIGADDLRAAHTAALARDRLKVAVVGAIGPEELGPLLDRLFGDLPDTGPPLPAAAVPVASGGTIVIDVDVPQSVIFFGGPGLRHGDPDFVPAMVMDHILGGATFDSRLMGELRERRGLTYGVDTYIATGILGGLYIGSFSSSNEHVGEALGVVRKEWARMAAEPVDDAELLAAKRYLTGEYPLRFEGNQRIAAQLLGIQVAGYGLEFVNLRNRLVEAVTAEDVARVAQRLLRPEALGTVVAGRPQTATAE